MRLALPLLSPPLGRISSSPLDLLFYRRHLQDTHIQYILTSIRYSIQLHKQPECMCCALLHHHPIAPLDPSTALVHRKFTSCVWGVGRRRSKKDIWRKSVLSTRHTTRFTTAIRVQIHTHTYSTFVLNGYGISLLLQYIESPASLCHRPLPLALGPQNSRYFGSRRGPCYNTGIHNRIIKIYNSTWVDHPTLHPIDKVIHCNYPKKSLNLPSLFFPCPCQRPKYCQSHREQDPCAHTHKFWRKGNSQSSPP